MMQRSTDRRPKSAGRADKRPSYAELQARVEQQAWDLAEAQAREQATAEVLAAISRSPTGLQRVLDTVVERALRLCAADGATVLRPHGDVLLAVAASGEPATLGLELPLGRGTVSGRAFLERRTIHVPDLATQVDTEYPEIKAVQQRFGYHSALAIPLLRRDGSAIGTLSISRVAAHAFTEAQIALVQTFADQAVIAIENAGLIEELQQRNREQTEALEREQATADVLRIISRAPTERQRVLDALVERAVLLTNAADANFGLLVDGLVRNSALYDPLGSYDDRVGRTRPITGGRVADQALLQRRMVHVFGSAAEIAVEYPNGAAVIRRLGHEQATILCVPLLRDGEPLGLLQVRRWDGEPFTEAQVTLLETFADQAVIAIENARLFEEVQERNREQAAALEREQATSNLLRVISQSPGTLQPVFDAIAEATGRLCAADDAGIATFDGQRQRPRSTYVIHEGITPSPYRPPGSALPPSDRGSVLGRAVLDGRTVHVWGEPEEIEAEYPLTARIMRERGLRAAVAVPLLKGGDAVGTIYARRIQSRPFTEQQIVMLQTFADQAVIAIENARLFDELQARIREQAEALEREQAMAEVLGIISRSPTDLPPVLEAAVAQAARLCAAEVAAIHRVEGGVGHTVAAFVAPGVQQPVRGFAAAAVSRDRFWGRAALDRRTVHVYGGEAVLAREFPESVAYLRTQGTPLPWAVLAVPLLRADAVIGVLALHRVTAQPFSDPQIALVETFADQAVIAIENARLFEELQASNATLREALEQQMATAGVLQAISRSVFDLQMVLDTLAEHAARLCDADRCSIWHRRGDGYRQGAAYGTGVTEEFQAVFTNAILQAGYHTLVGRTALLGRIVHIPDSLADEHMRQRESVRLFGVRCQLGVPMLREGEAIGVFALTRLRPQAFTERQIALVTTFADQAVIAIENARLFEEIQAKSRELEELNQQLEDANRHKSAFVANMSHELRTPLNAIIGYSEMLQEEAEELGQEGMTADLGKVNAAGKHLLGLINNILDLSKIEAGRMDLYLEDFAVADLIGDVTAVVQPLVEQHGNTLVVETDGDLGMMHADLTKVRQTLFNLLSNAAKFTEHGTIMLTVTGPHPPAPSPNAGS
jgi:GAF domain-containing protein